MYGRTSRRGSQLPIRVGSVSGFINEVSGLMVSDGVTEKLIGNLWSVRKEVYTESIIASIFVLCGREKLSFSKKTIVRKCSEEWISNLDRDDWYLQDCIRYKRKRVTSGH